MLLFAFLHLEIPSNSASSCRTPMIWSEVIGFYDFKSCFIRVNHFRRRSLQGGPGPLQKSLKNDSTIKGKQPVFEQFPIIQIGCQSCSAMTGGEAPFNSNSYKLLEISDEENLKRENLPPVLDIWKYRYDVNRGNKHL